MDHWADVPQTLKLLPAAAEGFLGIFGAALVDVFLAFGLGTGEGSVDLAARARETYGSCSVSI